MNSENFRELNLDGFDITLWKDHYVPNDQYTEVQWRKGVTKSMDTLYDSYVRIESLLNDLCKTIVGTAIEHNKSKDLNVEQILAHKEEYEKLKEPVIKAMKVLNTALKWRIMEHIWCTKPEWMKGVHDIEMNGREVWPLDKDGNLISNEEITFPL